MLLSRFIDTSKFCVLARCCELIAVHAVKVLT